MKKLLYLLLILPLLSISCSSDNDDYSNSDIVGTWVLESAVAKDVVTNNDSASQAIKYDVKTENVNVEPLTFTLDGKVSSLLSGKLVTGTYILNNNRITIYIDGSTLIGDITSISGNTLNLDLDQTDMYKKEIKYLISNWKDVEISKVISTFTYKIQ